ncbi:hypothetical protein JOF56_003491 [Kibdelosporangium banguiense]|uniref:Uncharacterized protein n=1 Tax=Kibdelosporangium banguiense TaxID=1365924 RepID=A0ABS4TFI9_9PSEU|nr:hypothetical protein [Kibdelosporangium banguiense]MBP2323106.1 hypothetical protein [Kibdelosporangium banguiense]
MGSIAMFDPVSLIVGALVRGMLAGVESVGQEVVVDGYHALRHYLVQRYGGQVARSVDELAADPRSGPLRANVEAALRRAGAERDPELVRLARRLTDLVDNPERVLADAPVDPVEQLKRFSGLRAIAQMLDQHMTKVLDVRSRYSVEDTDLLTRNVDASRVVPPADRAGLTGLHAGIRTVIESIARQIEEGRYQEVERGVGHLQIGLAERNRAQRLILAEKHLHISYESLRLTVEFLSELNRGILERIELEPGTHRLTNMMFGNAVLIYELADFVIGYVQGFVLNDGLAELHREAQDRISSARTAQQALRPSWTRTRWTRWCVSTPWRAFSAGKARWTNSSGNGRSTWARSTT